MKDLFDELVSGVGATVGAGIAEDTFQKGYNLPIANADGHTDDNIFINSLDDASGGAFASGTGGAIVLVQARAPWVKVVRNEALGGGASEVFHRDEYAYGERSPGNWLGRLLSDATAPTS